MKIPISITSIASVSALGNGEAEVWNNYKSSRHFLRRDPSGEHYAGALPEDLKNEILEIAQSQIGLDRVDQTVLYAIKASRDAASRAGWKKGEDVGINIGSSRGATQLLEEHYKDFLLEGKAGTMASPSTTLGSLSSWVAQDLQSSGVDISHSVTCSTALHAVLNGIAWLGSGMADKFLAGGSEAALTPFTFAQVKAMKIGAGEELSYPCQALKLEKTRNSMVLGEGAAVVCMEAGIQPNARAVIQGVGYATETLRHALSISANGAAFQRAMTMAMRNCTPGEIDVIVTHTPGTIKGDAAELNAIKAVFGDRMPSLTTNKWKIGHTYGASGALSLEMAVQMLTHQEFIPVPYLKIYKKPAHIRNILVNAVGFGGNAVSVLVSLPKGKS